MLPNHLEKIIFHNVLDNKEYVAAVKPNFFESQYYGDLFKVASEFVVKYNQTPTKEQMLEIVRINGLSNITREFLDALYDTDKNLYDPEWIEESTEAWIEFKKLDKSVEQLLTYLKTTKIGVENVKNVVETAKDIINTGTNIDFKFDEGLDFFDPESHKQPLNDTFSTGFPYLDLVLGGGWNTKSLYCVLGPMKTGKSIWLTNLCANAVRLGYNSAMISLEMKDKHVTKRLGANMLGISMSEYNETAEDQDMIRKRISNIGIDELKIPGKLYIKEFPTSSASTKDVERWLLKMEQTKGIKFKTIFIDYINILLNWRQPNSENLYMKIKQIAEDLRAMGIRNNWAIITATQTNRQGWETSSLSLSNISESGGLGHTVDWMGGIIQDELMHANNEYILQTMLNRNEGYKNSRKKFNIDYNYMRLTETMDPIIQDLY